MREAVNDNAVPLRSVLTFIICSRQHSVEKLQAWVWGGKPFFFFFPVFGKKQKLSANSEHHSRGKGHSTRFEQSGFQKSHECYMPRGKAGPEIIAEAKPISSNWLE